MDSNLKAAAEAPYEESQLFSCYFSSQYYDIQLFL